jgi:hypothetical protein
MNGVGLEKSELVLIPIKSELPPSEVDETRFTESFNGV